MASLHFYYDLLSQPCRALYIFMRTTGIQFEDKVVRLEKGEHLLDDYKKLNPFQTVPIIVHDNFKLTESAAILKYLCARFPDKVADHWYPSDIQRQAKVDAYMSWQHLNTRMNAMMTFKIQVIEPRMKNIPIDTERLRKFESSLEVTLDQIENIFLDSQPFLCGNEISIADLLGACELTQLLGCGRDIRKERPKIGAWIDRVRDLTQPHWDESHGIIVQVSEQFKEGKVKQ